MVKKEDNVSINVHVEVMMKHLLPVYKSISPKKEQ